MQRKKTRKLGFTIAISDGYCTWVYPLRMSPRRCIDDIALAISKRFPGRLGKGIYGGKP